MDNERAERIYYCIVVYLQDLGLLNKVLSKQHSKLMKVLTGLLFFMDFERYTTTLGKNIYFNSGLDIQSRLCILLHEAIHLKQYNDRGILHNIMYLFPQVLVVLTLLSFWNLWFLLCLLFLLPLPAIYRTYVEMEAYMMTYRVMTEHFNGDKGAWYNIIERYFTGRTYYYMMPIRWIVLRLFRRVHNKENVFMDQLLAFIEKESNYKKSSQSI